MQRTCFTIVPDEKAYDEATKVTAKDGEVILDGPDGVDVKLTPDAAIDTSDNLLAGAMKAQGQRIRKDPASRSAD